MKVHRKLGLDASFGEQLVAQFLAPLDGDWAGAHVWFGVDIPDVGEIDVLMIVPNLGLFVIEVKGHSLDQVLEYSRFEVKMAKSGATHPANAVRRKAQKLATVLKDQRGVLGVQHIPWIHSTVWWPQISKYEWKAKFPGIDVSRDAEAMLFAQQMQSGSFGSALDYLRSSPLRGQPAPMRIGVDSAQENAVIQFLDGSGTQPVVPVSVQRDIMSRRGFQSRKARDYPYGKRYQVCISGPPGNGKTSTLREIGIAHAEAGARVLFVCFNKTLANIVRRDVRVIQDEISSSQLFESRPEMDIFDEWALYKAIVGTVPPGTWPDRRAEAVQMLRRLPDKEIWLYDTILVDEAQDMSSECLQFLSELATEKSSMFVGFGDRQELYLATSEELLRWRESAESYRPIRSWRMARPAFLLAEGFFRKPENGSLETVKRALLPRLHPSPKANLEVDFGDKDAFPAGGYTSVQELPRFHCAPPCPDVGSRCAACRQLDSAILDSVRRSKRDGLASLLIALNSRSANLERIRKSLGRLGIPHHDLTIPDQKRSPLTPGHVVIVDHQDCRGLSSEYVLVFDFDNIYLRAKHHIPEYQLLQNSVQIVLSRAMSQTIIFVDSSTISSSPEGEYLVKILPWIQWHIEGFCGCGDNSQGAVVTDGGQDVKA